MEEIRSTEALDREILEDARKKAFKILKTSDDAVASQAKVWEEKTQKAVAAIQQSYAQNTEKARQEILARLPLDKRRLRSQSFEHFLQQAMNDFLENLSRNNLLLILERELEKRLAACGESDLETGLGENDFGGAGSEGIRVIYQRLDKYEVNDLLKKVFDLPGIRGKFKPSGFSIEQDTNSHAAFPVIILDTPAVRITASVERAAAELLRNNRAELTASLLGEEALND